MSNITEADLYVEFGDGNVAVLTTEDNKLILSKRLGTGKIGDKNPKVKEGDTFHPTANDIVLKFKNIESLRVVKDAIEDIEEQLKKEQANA